MPYAENGVKLYGNVIIASPKFLEDKPKAPKAFLPAFAKGAKNVLAQPDSAIARVKKRDGIINVDLQAQGILRDLQAARGFSVILVTHDLRESVFLADGIYVIPRSPGRLLMKREARLPRPRGTRPLGSHKNCL